MSDREAVHYGSTLAVGSLVGLSITDPSMIPLPEYLFLAMGLGGSLIICLGVKDDE